MKSEPHPSGIFLALKELKKEKEEKELRELSELTFKPKINRAPGSNNVSNKRTSSPSGQLSSRMNTQSTQRDRSDGNLEDGFRPRINKNSRNIAQGIIEDSSKDVVERLYSQVPNGSNNNGKKSEKKLQKMGSTKENRNDIPKNTSSSRRVTEEASILQDIENSSDDVNVNVNKFGVQQVKVPTIDLERYEQEQNKREKKRNEEDILNKIAAEISGVKKGSQGNQVVMDQLRHLLEMYSPQEEMEQSPLGGNVLTESLVGQENNKRSPAKKAANKEIEEKKTSPAKKPIKENTRSKSQVPTKKQEPEIEEPEPLNDSNTNDELEIASIKQNLLDIQGNLNTLKESFQHFQSSQVIPEVKLKFLQSPRQDPQPRKASKSPREQPQKSPLSSIAPSNITTPREKKKSVSRDKTPVEQREQRQNFRKTEEKASSIVIQSGSQTPRRNPSETRSGNTSPISPFKHQGNQIVLLPSDGYAKKLSRNASMTNTNRSEKQPESSTFGGLVTEKECQTPWSIDEIPKRDQYNQQPVQQIEMSFAVKEKKPREEKLLKLEKVEVEVLERIDEMDKSEIDREIEKIERDLNIKREEKIEKVEPVVIRIKENGDVSPSLKKFKDYEIFRLKDLDVEKPARKGNREKSKGSRSRSRNKGNNDFGYQYSINMMSSHAKTNDGKGSAKSLKEIAQMTLMKFKGDARSSTQGSCNDFQRILPAFE